MGNQLLSPGEEMDRAVATVIYRTEDLLTSVLTFSTNLTAAMIAAGNIVERGWDFMVGNADPPDIAQTWQALFQRQKNRSLSYLGFGATAPEAICRAILAYGGVMAGPQVVDESYQLTPEQFDAAAGFGQSGG